MSTVETGLYPILLENGIRLEVLRLEDAEAYFGFVNRQRNYLEKYDIFFKKFRTIEDVRVTLGKIQALRERGKSLTCAIWDKHTLIGFVNGGLKDDNTICFGFAIAAGYQGKGIVARAVTAILNYAFETVGVRSAWLVTWADNGRCIRLAERLGFKPDPERWPAEPEAGIPSERIVYRLANPRAEG